MKFNKRKYVKKFNFLALAITSIFLGLLLYSSHLQITDHDSYNTEVNTNTIKQRKLPAPRGEITDRNGVVLASTEYQNDLYIIPYYFKDDVYLLCADLQINCGELKEKIKKFSFNRILIAKNINEQLAQSFKLVPGLFIFKYAKRTYNTESATTHIIGYAGKINRDMLETDNSDSLYADDDYVGQAGLEYIYNRELHGINGAEQFVVMANGLELLSPNRFLPKSKVMIEPVAGNNLILSIDDRIQLVFAMEINDKLAGAVMLDIHTGAVLAMYSNPGFDPKRITVSFSNKDHPLINRAINSYAPGSTFKLVTALAALELGVVDPDKKEECEGSYSFGDRSWHCWKHEGHGKLGLRDAIKQSCDVYFYKLSQKVGLDNINKYARMLGFAEFTGIDLDNEDKGKMPVATMRGNKTFYINGQGTLLNTVIGQGVVQVSPLQLANAYATIINGGELHAPRIVMNGDKPIVLKSNHFKKENIDFLMDALYAVINEEGGTAYYSRIPGIEVAGKTGTAQIAGLNKKKKDNAWFVGYYPVINPQIVVCVFIEAGEHGSSIAPIGIKAMQEYSKEHAPISR